MLTTIKINANKRGNRVRRLNAEPPLFDKVTRTSSGKYRSIPAIMITIEFPNPSAVFKSANQTKKKVHAIIIKALSETTRRGLRFVCKGR